MLEVQPSPARTRAFSRLLAAIAAGAALVGCAVPPGPDSGAAGAVAGDAPDSTHSGADAANESTEPLIFDDVPPICDASCVTGIWITPPQPCACPAAANDDFTDECAAADCEETELLVMLPCGEAFRATVRYSESDQQFSAAGGGPEEGRWKYYDDAELRLDFNGNATYTPAECRADELQLKGHPTMSRPSRELDEAVFWAWLNDEWSGAPYWP